MIATSSAKYDTDQLSTARNYIIGDIGWPDLDTSEVGAGHVRCRSITLPFSLSRGEPDLPQRQRACTGPSQDRKPQQNSGSTERSFAEAECRTERVVDVD